MPTNAGEPSIEELRAQRDALDRQVAEATIGPADAFMALLGSDELTQLMEGLATAAASLDDATRRRLDQWVKAREAMVKLGELELARLRKLVG